MNSRKNAIVIGGSMAGLLAARVLSDHFENVTVIERDRFSSTEGNRRGVPHGCHAHGLLSGGLRIIEELFPGITADLLERGAVPADPLNDGCWFFEGGPLKQMPSGTTGVLLGRPLLENTVRRYVHEIKNVSILDGQSVRGLITEKDRVTGVLMHRSIEADLVVDATGRGSKSIDWLRIFGFPVPREEKVEVQLTYTTRYFRRRPDDLNGDGFAVIPSTPEGKRGGVILAQEDNKWVVTLFGHFGNSAPQDMDGFIDYAKSLPAPYIYNVIKNPEPVGEASFMRFPASRRRRFENLKRFPKGYLVFGDAICSFNPVYGQGMSVAAQQALALDKELFGSNDGLAGRFYKRAAPVIDNPWNIAVGADLKMPEARGKRTVVDRLLNRYIARLHKCAHHDAEAARAFVLVAQLVESPATLLRPSMIWRVLKHRDKSTRHQAESQTAAAGLRIQKPVTQKQNY